MLGASPSLTRRTLLAGAAASLVLPRAGRSQATGPVMRLRCRFADQDFTVRLLDNPTVQDLASLLPVDLTIGDFSTNEKIAHLPRRLDEGGHVPFDDEAPGDLCYFLGWGNLAFFHGSYSYRGDLIRLGHLEGGVAPLLVPGEFPLRLELHS